MPRDRTRTLEGAARAAAGGRPDSRAVALEMLSRFLLAGTKPPKRRAAMRAMRAMPRPPAGGAAMPPATAMAALARFLEAAREGGLADRRRRRG